MIHRALFGSYERFIGILLEDTAGELPLWLAPVQAIVLPIADRHVEAARDVRAQLRAAGRARRGRRAHRVGRAQDPRRRAAEGRRSCSSSATARPRTAPSRCASTARATPEPSPVEEFAAAHRREIAALAS